jgi:rhamnosyl/mannosyltransferase
MKILQVYKDYFPPIRGGIEGHINLLANGLQQRGHDVEVLVSNRKCKYEVEIIDGIRVTKVPQLNRIASAPLNYSLFFWMKKLAENADILHFHLPNPTAVMSYLIAGLNRKAVATYHSDIVRQRKLALFYRPFLKCFLNRIDRIIATSPNYVESSNILSQYQLKCQVVPLGIPLSRFTSQADNQLKVELLRQTHGTRLVLFIGKFRYYKGLHVFIEAMKQVNGKLLMIGEGYLEEDLKKQVAANELDGKITFLGELPDHDATAFLRACDVFVLPSIERSEAFGIVQLEAMACGKPVICTELGTGTTFINQHQKTGIVVEPNNPNALANAINLLLDNPDLRKQYGQAGFKRVEKYFSVDCMINDLNAVYNTCLSN